MSRKAPTLVAIRPEQAPHPLSFFPNANAGNHQQGPDEHNGLQRDFRAQLQCGGNDGPHSRIGRWEAENFRHEVEGHCQAVDVVSVLLSARMVGTRTCTRRCCGSDLKDTANRSSSLMIASASVRRYTATGTRSGSDRSAAGPSRFFLAARVQI